MELVTRKFALMGKRSSAYTLIELVVVIGIMAVLLGLGLARWTNYQDKEKLRSATQDVISWLRKIQTKASQGEKPSTDCPTLDYYEISEVSDGLQASVFCLDEGGTSVSLGLVDSVSVEDIDVNLDSNFRFYSGFGITEQSRTISLTYAGNTSEITVSESGKISWQMN